MSANQLQFTVVVNAQGLVTGLKQVTNFGNETQKAGKKAKVAGDEVSGLNYKMNQGIIGSAAAGRSFSKLSQSIGSGNGGLVGAYATLAANMFAVSAAFSAFRGAQQAEMVLKGLEAQGARTGRSLTVASERLREIVGFGIDAQESMQATALFTSTGFKTEELERLGQVAKNTSLALGRNMPDALDRLIKGTTKLEPELLDELGIMTKLGDATAAYALKTGKNVDSLSAFQKRQAFLNAVLAEGELKFGGLSDKIETNPYDKLSASFSNLTKILLNFGNETLGAASFAEFLSENMAALAGVTLLFASTIQKNLLGSLTDLSARYVSASAASREQAKVIRDEVKAKLELAKANISAELAAQRNIQFSKNTPKAIKAVSAAIQEGTLSQEEYADKLKTSARSLRAHKALQAKEEDAGKDTTNRANIIATLEAERVAMVALAKAELDLATKIIPLETSAVKQMLAERGKSITARAQESAAAAVQAASERQAITAVKLGVAAVREYSAGLAKLRIDILAASGATGVAALTTRVWTGVMNTAKVAAFGLNLAVRTLTAGLLSLISVVGIAFLVFGAIKATFEFLYEKAYPNTVKANKALAKASEELGKVLETQNEAFKEQARILESVAPVGDRVLATWVSQSNAAIELAQSLRKLVTEREALKAAEALDATAQTAFAGSTEGLKATRAGQFGIETTSAAFEVLPDTILEATTGMRGLKAALIGVDTDSLHLVQSATTLGKTMGTVGLVKAIITSVGSLEKFKALTGDQREKVFAEIQEANADSATKMTGAIDDLNSALAEGSTEAAKFFKGAVPQTPFDGVVNSFTKLNASIATFTREGKTARQTLAVITKIAPEMENFLAPKDSALLNSVREAELVIVSLTPKLANLTLEEKAKLEAAKGTVANSQKNLEVMVMSLSKVEQENRMRQESIALSKAQSSFEQARFGKISEFMNIGAAGARAQVAAQNRSIDLSTQGAKIQKAILDTMIAQRQAVIDKEKAELITLTRQKESLLLEEKITLEKYKQHRQALLEATSGDILQPGANIPALSSAATLAGKDLAAKTAERVAFVKKLEEQTAQVAASEKANAGSKLASRLIEIEIAGAAVSKVSADEKQAQEGIARVRVEAATTERRLVLDRLKAESKVLDAQLGDAASGNVIQGNSLNSGVPLLRGSFASEAEILRIEFDRSLDELTSRSDIAAATLAKERIKVEAFSSRARGADEVQGVKDTLKEMDETKANAEAIFTTTKANLQKQFELNILKQLGLSDGREVLQLEQEILAVSLKKLEAAQELARATFAQTNTKRDIFASATGATLLNQDVRQADFALKQAEEAAELRRATINMEYALLEAQRKFLEDKLRAGAKELKIAKRFDESDSVTDLANQVGANQSTLAVTRDSALAGIDTDIQQKKLEKSKAMVTQYTSTLLENFKKLGPEGEMAAAVFSGMTQITFATEDAFNTIGDKTASTADKIQAVGAVISSVISTISSILQAGSDAKIAGIDKEIAAEQKRDGKSAESVSKIQAMESRKDQIARKSFNLQKKIMMAQAIVSTAAGVAGALAAPFGLGIPLAIIIGAMGAAQLAIIASTQYQSSASKVSVQAPSTLSIGKRSDTVDLARGPNANAGGESGFIRGSKGSGSNASNYSTIGSAYGGELMRGYGNRGFVVGEKGPEILTPETPIKVTPANEVGGQAPVNATFNIQALDSSGVQDLLVAQKGNIIKMLRDAANASGQGFLENVNVNVYTRPNVQRL